MKIKSKDTKEFFEVEYDKYNCEYKLHGAIRDLIISTKLLKKYIGNGELIIIEE